MNRNQAKELFPILQAFAEGKEIESRVKDKWYRVLEICNETNPQDYRIKPEPKYRPFKDAEECWQEMLKHQPFGWLKYKKYPYFALITTIHSGNTVSLNGKEGWDFLHIMNNYVFADNIPFGVKVEE